jgi:tRNA-Thr(GGU) m(6)t(6)A37 methyltransferase TsaA
MNQTVGAPDCPEAVRAAGMTASSGRRKLLALATVCASLMVITLDFTILNVALPTLALELRADSRDLQWFVNAYELVLAGLLLTGGALADRFGRRRVLAIGLTVFGAASVAAAAAGGAGELIAARAVMGVGGALVVPTTLSIVTNVFTDPSERGRAIAVWTGVAALGLGTGPLVGGVLLRHFYWGSVFIFTLPLVGGALAAGRITLPESRDPGVSRLDPIGAALSVVALGTLLYGVTEGPERGWTEPIIAGSFVVSAAALVIFINWERRRPEPMLDFAFFRDRRFSTAIVVIMTVFFGMFALMFVLTQFLQSVLGYDALGAGVRLLPLPAMLLVSAQVSVRVASRVGTRAVVTTGLAIAAAGLAAGSTLDASYGVVAVALAFTGAGVGCTMAPAVESLMSTLPARRAGVAAALNDTTRLSAGAVGIAVVGSLVASSYRASVSDAATAGLLSPSQQDQARASIAGAVSVVRDLDRSAGGQVLAVARQGFVDGATHGLLLAAIVAAVGGLIAWRYLPAASNPHHIATVDSDQPGNSDGTVIRLHPIGIVASPLTNPSLAPCQGEDGAPDAWITINGDVTAGLRDLNIGDEVLVLTWLDRARRDVLEVHPQGNPANPILGVFSTRSPHRPNPIGIHPVRIRAIDGDRLQVGPLDAVDRTPVIDIKPVLNRDHSAH